MKQKMLDQMLLDNNGVLKTADVISAGISKEYFYQYIKKTGLEKSAHGIYVSHDAWTDEMYLLQAQFPKIIFSHETALYLHDLAEKEPIPLSVTVDAKYNSASLTKMDVEVFYTKKEWHTMGVCQATSPAGHTISTYDMERTICDIIRKRSHMDAAVFNYAITNYAKLKNRNYVRLMEYAKALNMERQVYNTMGVLL